MTYTSANPGPLTPQQKLADKKWRYINSWWIFPSLPSLGFLGWLGFMVAAIRTGQRKYWVFTGVYAALLGVAITMLSINPDGPMSDLAAIPRFGAWLGPTIHAAILNREYLTTLAAKGEWYRAPVAQPNHSSETAPAPFLGVTQSDYYAPDTHTSTPPQTPTYQAPMEPTPSPEPLPSQSSSSTGATATRRHSPNPTTAPGRLHANTATVDNLTGLPGVGPALAQRIVAVRDARGGYRDINDLAAAADLQPHELIRLRSHLTFDENTRTGQPQDGTRNPSQPGGTGRILDI